jgi:signal transduction histidine kinase
LTLKNTVAAYTHEGLEITVAVDEELDEGAMTDSQRIALIRIVQGALANVVLHSRARTATVSVRQLPDGVEAQIVDDGEGFVVQPTLRRASESGRLGLVGMRERARLLGGTLNVESARGGPTRILLHLPRWRPRLSEVTADTGQTGGEIRSAGT